VGIIQVQHSNTIDALLLVIDILEELILVGLGGSDGAVLGNGVLELAVNLELSEGDLLVGAVSQVEDAAIVFITVTCPQRASLPKEVFLDVHVPIFVLTVELEVVPPGHVIDVKDTVIAVHGKVLNSSDRGGYRLLKVVNFVHMLSFTPEAIGTVDEYEVLITVVDHLAHVIEVNVLQESED
jgi:hypothetical protein